MMQHIDFNPIRVRLLKIPTHDLHLKWKIDVRAIFERNLHDALTRYFDDLNPSYPIF